jgi:hypothetical protein
VPKFNWQKMLKRWSDAIIASGEYAHLLDANAAATKWAGFPPASETAIAETERRLKRRLPESYRRFLGVSNGWWLDGADGPTRLWHIEEVQPMAEADPETTAIWSRAEIDLGESDDPADLPNSHYASVIQISDDNDGRYVLNPLIEPHEHEWQAAFFANWVPGAECYASFQDLMEAKFEAFCAAHLLTAKRQSSARDLAKPPTNPIGDSQQFIDELQSLGFFELMPVDAKEKMIRDFLEVSRDFTANKWQLLEGPFASPGAVLCDPISGRVVNLDIARLATERGRYAIAAVRPLLASVGIEFGTVEELVAADSYSVTLEGVNHHYFRLRKGHPSLQGGEHEINAAGYVLYETGKLLNKVLKQRQKAERIATLEELQTSFSTRMRLSLVLLDDELSYLFMWSPAVHNYCRPMRPDVFR